MMTYDVVFSFSQAARLEELRDFVEKSFAASFKRNTSSLAEALRAYRVGGGEKISFLEPRGLINPGNMCYMNSVSCDSWPVVPICIPCDHSNPGGASRDGLWVKFIFDAGNEVDARVRFRARLCLEFQVQECRWTAFAEFQFAVFE